MVPIVPINDWEMASRLSYFLWSEPPDASYWMPRVLGNYTRLIRSRSHKRYAEGYATRSAWLASSPVSGCISKTLVRG